MRTVIILRGLPASYKSTFAKKLIAKEPMRWIRVNRDDLRGMCNNYQYDPNAEVFIRSIQDTLTASALAEGYDVIADNTWLVPKILRKFHRMLESIGDIKVIEKCFNVPVDECLRRNALREDKARVPDNAIIGMAKSAGIDRGRVLEDAEFYYPPIDQQPKSRENNEGLKNVIIVDLDGTLSLLNGRNPYDATHCDKDLPNIPVIECVKAMYTRGYGVVFMSGRENKYREPTEKFIAKHLPELPYELYMRKTNDSRKDSIVKGELFEANVASKYNVLCVFDDRKSVVNYWRSIGLVCLQVAEGNF